MRKLTEIEKHDLVSELRLKGWKGCVCEDCLVVLANKILDYQFKINEKENY